MANDYVLQNSPVTTRLMALDDARASGARALFGEKYGDEVRVVAMGEGSGNTMGWSVELCGGTHVRRTGDIGLISGVSDSGVAAGVRRIEALTGTAARKAAHGAVQLAKAASSELKVSLEDMPARIASLLDERKKLERDLADARKKLAMGGGAAGRRQRRRAQHRRHQAAGARGLRHRHQGPEKPRRRGQEAGRLRRGRHRRRHRGGQGRRRGRRHGGPHRRASTPSIWCARAPRRWAARAAAAGPTWRRPAAPTAPRPTPR